MIDRNNKIVDVTPQPIDKAASKLDRPTTVGKKVAALALGATVAVGFGALFGRALDNSPVQKSFNERQAELAEEGERDIVRAAIIAQGKAEERVIRQERDAEPKIAVVHEVQPGDTLWGLAGRAIYPGDEDARKQIMDDIMLQPDYRDNDQLDAGDYVGMAVPEGLMDTDPNQPGIQYDEESAQLPDGDTNQPGPIMDTNPTEPGAQVTIRQHDAPGEFGS